MSEFKPIETQEEFDNMIKDRLTRERAKFADYDDIKSQLADANSKIADFEKTIEKNQKAYDDLLAASNEKDTKIAGYEADALRTSVVINKKLPFELRKYLQGSTEEELHASADELLKFQTPQQVPPLGDPEPKIPKDSKQKAMRDMLKSINNGGK